MIIVVSKPEDINKIKTHNSIRFKCVKCGKEVTCAFDNRRKERYKKLMCRNCYNKDYWMTTFGVDNPAKLKESHEKAKLTMIERYGTDNFNNREKAATTMIERYGGKTTWECQDLKEKIQKDNLNKFGSVSPFGSKEIQEKSKQTNIYRYGSEYPFSYGSDKYFELMEKRYGNKSYLKTENFKEKMVDEFGTLHPNMKYYYDEMFFDSKWELAYWIYNVDNNVPIIREPISLEFEFDGKSRHCYPDFEVNGELIEIKGDHFFKDDKMINPFDRTQDELSDAKTGAKINAVYIETDKPIKCTEDTSRNKKIDKFKGDARELYAALTKFGYTKSVVY